MSFITNTREADVLASLLSAACRALSAEGRMVEAAEAVALFSARLAGERQRLQDAEAMQQARALVAKADTESAS